MRCIIIKPEFGVVEMHTPDDKPPQRLEFVEPIAGTAVRHLMADNTHFKKTAYEPIVGRDYNGELYFIYLLAKS